MVSQVGSKVQRMGSLMTLGFSAPVAAITGLGAAVGINLVSKIQGARISFEAFMHSGKKASDMIKRLRDYATKSPIFDTPNVIEYAQRLMGVGVSAGHIFPSLKALEYMTAKYGLNVQNQEGILNAWVQVLGKGRAYSEELTQQMSEHGIPIWHILAQQFHVTEATMHKMVQKGQVSAKDFQKAMETMARAGDFDKVIKKKSQTLSGVWSQMKEQAVNALGTAIQNNMGVITKILGIMGDTMRLMAKNSTPFFKVFGILVAGLAGAAWLVVKAFDKMPGPVKYAIAAFVAFLTVLGPILFIFGAIAAAAGPVIAVIGFIAANAAIVGTIAAIAGGLIVLGVIITGGAIAAWYFFGKAIRVFMQSALKPLGAGFAALKDAFHSVGAAITGSIGPAFGTLRKSMGGPLIGMARALGHALGAVTAFFMRLIAATIKGQLAPQLRALGRLIKDNSKTFHILGQIIKVVVLAPLFALAVVFVAIAWILTEVLIYGIMATIAVIQAIIAVFAFLGQVCYWVKDAVMVVVRALVVAAKWVRNYFNTLNNQDWWGSFKRIFTEQIPGWAIAGWHKAAAAFGWFRQKFSQFISLLKGAAGGKLWAFFTKSIPGWAGTMARWVKQRWQEISAKIYGVVYYLTHTIAGRIWNFFTKSIPYWAGVVARWVKQRWQEISAKIYGVVYYLTHTIAGRIWNFFTKSIPYWAGVVARWVKQRWQEISAKIYGVVYYLTHTIAARIWNFFTKSIPYWAGVVARWVKQRWQEISAKIYGVVYYLTHTIAARIWNFFTKSIPYWAGVVARWVKKRWQEISDKINGVVHFLTHTIAARIWNFFTKSIPYWTGVMGRKVKALWADMRDGIGKIWKKIQSLAAKPIIFVIETVIKNGILAGVKKVADVFGLSDISKKVKGAQAGLGSLIGQMKRSYATGGWVRGPGGPTDDKIPAMLSNREYVIRAASVKRMGVKALDYINNFGMAPEESRMPKVRRATGGLVTPLRLAYGGSIDAMLRLERKAGVPFTVSSGYRPGAHDYHGQQRRWTYTRPAAT